MVDVSHGGASGAVLDRPREQVRFRHIPRIRAQPQNFENKRALYYLLIPLLYLSGLYVQIKALVASAFGHVLHTNVWYVDGLSVNSRRVKDGAARWPALDAVYNFEQGEGSLSFVRWVDDMWLHVRNAQAVRNRLKIAKHELRKAILATAQSIWENKERARPIRLLSLAAGSAQGVLEVVAELQKEGINVEVVLVDHDITALSYAMSMAEQLHVEQRVRVVESDVTSFPKKARGFEPDIIEMLGLLDYCRTSLAIALIKRIWVNLPKGGFFLTCHVHPNHESYFLHHVVNWRMLYRTRGELEDLLTEGNFVGGVRLVTEPQGIHTVAVARKV